jgi:hypothetical protein
MTILQVNGKGEAKPYIVFLDNLLETGIVQLGILGQVMHVRDDITQLALEEQEVSVAGWV